MAPPTPDAIRSLNTLIDSAATLVRQLKNALAEIKKSPSRRTKTEGGEAQAAASPDSDAFQLAKDSASLIKAHTTKLSLLVITDPLTPSAISTVIRELVSGPLTGLATSVELCEPGLYTQALQHELLWFSQCVYDGLLDFLSKIPRDGKVLTGSAKAGFATGSRGSLGSTGVLWSACDNVVELATKGLRGFYVQKVGQWRATLRDIEEELKEWGDEEPDEDEDDQDEGNDVDGMTEKLGNTHLSAQEMVDDLMDMNSAIPRDDPDGIRPRLESALRRLRLAVILCMAVDKRRMKKLPTSMPTKDLVSRLDDAAEKLQQLPEDFGDLTAAFYELDPEEIDEVMERCCATAVAVGETLNLGWEGEADEFTEWMGKFRSEIRKA